MKILILGGDGYLGWPQAMYLSSRGHDVHVVDNLARRAFDLKYGFSSLTPLASPHGRLVRWRERSGRSIGMDIVDLTDYDALARIFRKFRPDTVVHFAEQRSAPYSMIDREHALFTQVNNVVGTLNVLFCIKEYVPDAHLVKLGSMGEYGTPNIDIEEGYIEIVHKGRKDVLPYPKQPFSFYHLSKVHDSHNVLFCCRVWGLRATDLNQGTVYGCEAVDEANGDPALATRYDYDQIYGTVLNRFCLQTVLGQPLTVYGEGGQTRGHLDIRDTMRCVELAVLNPAAPGECRVFNQFTEEFSVLGLAEWVCRVGRDLGYAPTIQHLRDPRVEREQHYYNAAHTKLEALGLEPNLLTDETLRSLIGICRENIDRADPSAILPTVDWRSIHNAIGHGTLREVEEAV
jgi:UDP-sulfoquinovose synthase